MKTASLINHIWLLKMYHHIFESKTKDIHPLSQSLEIKLDQNLLESSYAESPHLTKSHRCVPQYILM